MQIEKNKKFVDYGKRSVGENIGALMHKMDGDSVFRRLSALLPDKKEDFNRFFPIYYLQFA